MSDLSNYFDINVNTPRLEAKVSELEVLTKNLEARLRDSLLANRKKDVMLSTLRRKIKNAGLDNQSRTDFARDAIAKVKEKGFSGKVIDAQKTLAKELYLSIRTIQALWYKG